MLDYYFEFDPFKHGFRQIYIYIIHWFMTKTDSTGLARFWLGLAQFFPVRLNFFRFGFGSVRFFRFQAYKTETEPVGFFKILIGFFSWFGFFDYCFPVFSVFLFLRKDVHWKKIINNSIHRVCVINISSDWWLIIR
jgi:hypothetical protein